MCLAAQIGKSVSTQQSKLLFNVIKFESKLEIKTSLGRYEKKHIINIGNKKIVIITFSSHLGYIELKEAVLLQLYITVITKSCKFILLKLSER